MMGRAVSWRLGVLAAAACSMAFMGHVEGGGRFRSVAGRASVVTITAYSSEPAPPGLVCAYQQSKRNGNSVLARASPQTQTPMLDVCGTNWYPVTLNVQLLSNDEYWFQDSGPEYTHVFVSAPNAGWGLHTATADEAMGPSDATTCLVSRTPENRAIQPLTYFNGAVPADLDCSGASRSFAGCPFTCNLPQGCDQQYGKTLDRYYEPSFRQNSMGQSTALTRYDHYGYNAAVGPPGVDWSYLLETGSCQGGSMNGQPCDSGQECPGGSCINQQYTVMRRNAYTIDSLNIRRGENRRNLRASAWVKNKYSDVNNRMLGIVGRWYNADNYFLFLVEEYGGDYGRLSRYVGGVYQTVVAPTQASFNLMTWTRLSFSIRDNGSYTDAKFVPNGTCAMTGYVSGNSVVTTSSTDCSNAPYGGYGVFSYANQNAQFRELSANGCTPNITGGYCYE